MMLNYTIEGEVTITQKRFIDKLLLECDDIVGESNSPQSTELFAVDENSPLLDNKKQDLFHSRTQSLLYDVKSTRLDIQIVVGFLARRVKKATEEDWGKLCKAINFIRRTRDTGLRLRIGKGRLRVAAFVDVSIACHADRKSHTGCIFIGDYGCTSSSETINAKSSSEEELIGLTDK